MDFKDISNKELRELNLYPINKFKNFKIRCDTGYYDIYCKRDNHEKIFRYPCYFGSYGLEYVPHWDDLVFVERIEMKNFLDMCQKINKKSVNEIDLLNVGSAIKVDGTKKRSRYSWDINSLLDKLNNQIYKLNKT